MQDNRNQDSKAADPFEMAQRVFAAVPQFQSASREQWQRFWGNQEKILDSMLEFSSGWFERRHEGTRLAQQAVGEMCDGHTPMDAVLALQTWAAGSMARMVSDGIGWQKHLANVAGLVAAPASVAEPSAKSKPAPVRKEAA